ncbi:MAG TPA: MFS transporter [Thauera sp.]|jgi:GPH family glycoside/pentoside/hexuronide:cation symporter|nr:MFS transporter [Thauera sp.]
MNEQRARAQDLMAYGALGLPLAFAALPLYVHVPRLYAGLGLSLATVGAVLLAARVVDALSDPLIGWAVDRLPGRRKWVMAALPVLGLGMVGLLSPPAGSGALWLLALLVLVSLGYSVATIAYHAWGAEVAATSELRTRYVASREAFALLGVMLAAALPSVLAAGQGESLGLARLAMVFVPVLILFGLWTLLRSPVSPPAAVRRESVYGGLAAALRVPGFGRLLTVFALNGIAAAIPSATVLFFVADVLGAADVAGLFLVLYFLAAAASLPLWVALSRRYGKLQAWLAGMVLAVVVFGWAATLGDGELIAYGVVCVLSGLALGADLSLPPSLLADLLAVPAGNEDAALAEHHGLRAVSRQTARTVVPATLAGACFGWWNFVTKANLALAAGVALPLLAVLGYAPGERGSAALLALSISYAGLPVLFKLGAIALLWRWRDGLETACARQGGSGSGTNSGVCES